MFFTVSKVLGFFAVPSNALAMLLLAALLLFLAGRRRAACWTGVAAALAVLVVGYSPLATVGLLTLTERFPPWQANGRVPDGIIVLGGAIDSDATAARGLVEIDSAGDRILAMLDLARRYPKARIVFTGGSGNLIVPSLSEAPVAGQLLREFGVDPSRITLETQSRTTDENAAMTRALLQPRPGEVWLLVTSAFHMPRSVAVFRAAGFEVEAYPVDFRTRGWRDALLPFDQLSAGLARADIVAHEWTGLLAYRLGGRTKELLPSPR
jgi:uncharacterized SAM-binding protein YcdF (DUF218 family)